MYFLLTEHFSFDELWQYAKQKHVGLDEYWFCQALLRVSQLKQLPRMVKPLSLEVMRPFFLQLHDVVLSKI